MRTSDNGITLIKQFEGYRNKAYKCPSGVWTIGYGHTKGVTQGMQCTSAQADTWLREDLLTAEKAVSCYTNKYFFDQNQFDALVSFTYNCGSGNLRKLLDNGNRTIAQVASHWLLYNKSNGKTLEGLTRRRKEELKLFNSICEYYPAYGGNSPRIDDVFEDIGAYCDYDLSQTSRWKSRKPIAVANGIPNYTGTASQNNQLISLARLGKLRKRYV